jgi:hypothetical protein
LALKLAEYSPFTLPFPSNLDIEEELSLEGLW